MGTISILQGDITEQRVDAIVNAANNSLRGGGGVDGAIHRKAGPRLLSECITLGGCATGEAKITKGYDLASTWVIHTVGPVWRGGDAQEEKLLASCYRNSLELALSHNINTIAFPSISTGVYRFPKRLAATIAYREIKDFLADHAQLQEVRLICFDDETYHIYQELDTKTSTE